MKNIEITEANLNTLDEIILVSTCHINRKLKSKLSRNQLVLITNQDTGDFIHLKVQADRSLKKGMATLSYDSAVSLGLETSALFKNKTKNDNLQTNITIGNASHVKLFLELLKSPDMFVRTSAIMSFFGFLQLTYTVPVELFGIVKKLFSYLS